MAMKSGLKVPLPDSGIIVRKSGKYRYVYKVLNTYRTEKGQPTNDRKLIGKMDSESGMLIPNAAYWELYGIEHSPNYLPTYESVRSIGATFLVKSILRELGVIGILENVFGANKASSILTAAIYMVCRGNIFERVQDWCEGYTLNELPLASAGATMLFSSVSHDERMSFFKAWVALRPQHEYLAYDVTSFSTYATGIHDAEWGYNRDKENLQQINLGCYLSQGDGMPLFYVTYSGSITDKTHLPFMMAYNADLGIEGVCFITDRGFCMTSNIKYMHSSRKSYICGAEIYHKALTSAVKSVMPEMLSMKNLINQGVYARTVHSRFYGVTTTLHIYLDPENAERQRKELLRTVKIEDEKLSKLEQLTKKEAKRYGNHFDIELADNGTFKHQINYDKIDNIAKTCGYFGLLTNQNINCEDTLSAYRRKDVIEKGFDELKNHIDMKRLRTHNSSTTDGKMFCAFIALIAISRMSSLLSEFMKSKSMSKDGLISELEKIKIVTISNGMRLMNPVTKTQRTILEACNLSEENLKAYINGL